MKGRRKPPTLSINKQEKDQAMKFEVQQYTLCEGWVNTWSIEEEGVTTPQLFDSKAEAQAEIDEFLREIAEEIEYGERDPDNGYDAEDFRVVPASEN